MIECSTGIKEHFLSWSKLSKRINFTNILFVTYDDADFYFSKKKEMRRNNFILLGMILA